VPDYCVQYNVGASLKMNEPLQDTLIPLSLKGLHGRPIRATVIPRGATNGGRKLTARFGPRLIVVRAKVQIVRQAGVDGAGFDWSGSPAAMTAYLTRVNALLEAWEDGLEALLNTPFTLSWTPTGGAGKSLTVTYGYEGQHFEMVSEGEYAMVNFPEVTFGLVAETG
jgi:hypothetical protein